MFEHIPPVAPDPIFSIADQCQRDERHFKIDLVIGLYFNEQGKIPLLDTVFQAEKQLVDQHLDRRYLPMDGLAPFHDAVEELFFGPEHPLVESGRVTTIQTLGGTGALSLGAAFLHQVYPQSEVWISDPSWDNHHALFATAGTKTHVYPFFKEGKVQFQGFLDTLHHIPEESIVLIQPCCHNPTGATLSTSEWTQIIDVIEQRQLIPFLDIAYLGLGKGLEADAWLFKEMIKRDMTVLLSSSFSKNLALYAERIGALSIVCPTPETARKARALCKILVRGQYSTPPVHGALLATTVLKTPDLHHKWFKEVEEMRQRISQLRHTILTDLQTLAPHFDASFITQQEGMFSYLPLSLAQIERLRDEFAIYMLHSGRINIAGLNRQNIHHFTQSLAKVL